MSARHNASAIHKLDVARERHIDELERLVRDDQFERAIGVIQKLQGLRVALDTLSLPDESFYMPEPAESLSIVDCQLPIEEPASFALSKLAIANRQSAISAP